MRRFAWSSWFVVLLSTVGPPSVVRTADIKAVVDQWIDRLTSEDGTDRRRHAYACPAEGQDRDALAAELMQRLRHEDAWVRRCSAAALGELGALPQDSIRALIDQLGDTDRQVCVHAALSLAKFGSDAVPDLLGLLRSQARHSSQRAAPSPSRAGDVQAMQEHGRAVLHEDVSPQIQYVYIALAEMGLDAIGPLTEYYSELNQQIGQDAAVARIDQRWSRIHPLLSDPAQLESDAVKELDLESVRNRLRQLTIVLDVPFQSHCLAARLEQMRQALTERSALRPRDSVGDRAPNGPAAAAVGAELVRDVEALESDLLSLYWMPRVVVARLVASSLSSRSARQVECAPIWLRFLAHNDPAVRSIALRNLPDDYQPSSDEIPTLIAALAEPDASMVETYLVRLGAAAADGLVRRAKSDSPDATRLAYVKVLGQLGRDASSALPHLRSLLVAPSLELRRRAADSIRRILADGGTDPNVPQLTQSLLAAVRDEDAGVATSALRTLVHVPLDAEQMVPPLLVALRSEDTSRREAALEALSRQHPRDPAEAENATASVRAALRQVIETDRGFSRRDKACVAFSRWNSDRTEVAAALGAALRRAKGQLPESILILATMQPEGTLVLRELLQPQTDIPDLPASVFRTVPQRRLERWAPFLELLRSADSRLRLEVAASMADAGQHVDQILPILAQSLLSPQSQGRIEARSLARLGMPGAAPLAKALRECPAPKRLVIMEALAEAESVASPLVAVLSEQLSDSSDELRYLSIVALGKAPVSDVKNVVPQLVDMLADDSRRGLLGESVGDAAAVTLERASQAVAPEMDRLVTQLQATHPSQQRRIAQVLGAMGQAALPAREALVRLLRSDVETVRWAAGEALSRLGEVSDADWPLLTTLAFDRFVSEASSRDLGSFRVAVMGFDVRTGDASGGSAQLPPFPWPPPRWTHRGIAGQDFPRTFLGTNDSTLGDVHQRIIHSLKRADKGFETGTFHAPGGFILLARLERIEPDGTPLAGSQRWRLSTIPPASLLEYVQQLFREKPGYFRFLAFVVTSDAQVGAGSGEIPPISQGAATLPLDVAELPFKEREAQILVYCFRKHLGGPSQPLFTSELDIVTHLTKAGVWAFLGEPL